MQEKQGGGVDFLFTIYDLLIPMPFLCVLRVPPAADLRPSW